MPVNIKVSIEGTNRVQRELNQRRERISEFAPFWRSVAVPILKNKLRDIFLQEGPGWAPLDASTLKSRKYPGLPILQQTGALMRSVVNHPVITISQNQLTYGTNNPYAEYHEEGTSKMPARPFLGPAQDEVLDEIRQAYIRYLLQDFIR